MKLATGKGSVLLYLTFNKEGRQQPNKTQTQTTLSHKAWMLCAYISSQWPFQNICFADLSG